MSFGKMLASVGAGLLTLGAAAPLWAIGPIAIPNASFSTPTAPNSEPYAIPDVNNWLKAGQGFSESNEDFHTRVGDQLYQTAGTFKNVPSPDPRFIDNVDADQQAAFLFAGPGLELHQLLGSMYTVGESYQFTVAMSGGGYYMPLGTPIELRLYYLDPTLLPGDPRVTIGTPTVVTNTHAPTVSPAPPDPITHLSDFSVSIPTVLAGDPWAGKNIGIQIATNLAADPQTTFGYWDIDNARLASVPEPAMMVPLLLAAVAWRRRKTG